MVYQIMSFKNVKPLRGFKIKHFKQERQFYKLFSPKGEDILSVDFVFKLIR